MDLSFQLRSLQICGAFLELHLRFQQSNSRKRETLCSGLRVNHYAGKIMMLWLISLIREHLSLIVLVISILWRRTSTGRRTEMVPCRQPLTALTAVVACRLSWLARREAPGSRECGHGSLGILKVLAALTKFIVMSLLPIYLLRRRLR
jgi:hypothetical protein